MSNKNKKRDGIVFSTNPDYSFGGDAEQEPETLPPGEQKLYVRREVRNGKPAVVVKEFIGSRADLQALEKKLKQHCGVGGSAKDGEILIQGELLDKVRAYLQQLGYRTKG
jgi:translation initiation factor 1